MDKTFSSWDVDVHRPLFNIGDNVLFVEDIQKQCVGRIEGVIKSQGKFLYFVSIGDRLTVFDESELQNIKEDTNA